MRRGLIISFLLLTVQAASGQFYNRGQEPTTLRWLQIETDHFKVVYPKGYDKEGNYILNLLEHNYKSSMDILPVSKIKIPVVVHNRLSEFNGSVVWAPKRIELYPSPGRANNLPQDNLQQLVSHELTHVFEMMSLNKGLTKVGGFLTGEASIGVVSALLQKWYLEGQAVFEESRLSLAGRGRSPSFLKETKAISYLGDNSMPYSYDRMLLGSYKEKIPTYYNLGYDMVSYTVLKYGQERWKNMIDYTARRPFVVLTTSSSLKRDIGLSSKDLFEETYSYLGEKWQRELEQTNPIAYSQVAVGSEKEYESYHSPIEIRDNRVVAIKRTLDRTPAIVLINLADTTEKRIHEVGDMNGSYTISASGDKIVWIETVKDPRWTQQSYSVIKIMDITTGRVRQLSRHSRYFSATISPSENIIAVVSNSVNNDNSVLFIDSSTGEIVSEFPTPENIYLHRPQWSKDGESITFISLNREGEGVYRLFFSNEVAKWERLMEEDNIDLQSVAIADDGTLFYISSLTGTENLFMLSSEDSVRRITNTFFGIEDLSVGNGRLWFTDYTSRGNKIVSIDRTDFGDFPIEKYNDYVIDNIVESRHELKPDSSTIELVNYDAKPYRKMAHLFNLHSWLPLYIDVEDALNDFSSSFRVIRPGVTLFSQNLLGTVVSDLGYEYDIGHSNLHANINFMGLYPMFKLSADYGTSDMLFADKMDNQRVYKSTNLMLSSKMSVPLTFNRNSYYLNVVPSVTFSYSNTEVSDVAALKGSFYTIDSRFYINRYHSYSHRDIFPRWGQYIDVRYITFPFNQLSMGDIFMFRSALYFPGGFQNASLRLRYMYDSQTSIVKMKTSALIRGTLSNTPPPNKNHLFSVDYTFPIFYPDWNLGGLLYTNRLRATLFFDYGVNASEKDGMIWHKSNSKGIELYSDLFLFRFPFPISVGVRTSWIDKQLKPVWELLFTISIN